MRRIGVEDIGWPKSGSVDPENHQMDLAFKRHPWEWMFHDAFGANLRVAPALWIELPWNALLSNKAHRRFCGHPNLLAAFSMTISVPANLVARQASRLLPLRVLH